MFNLDVLKVLREKKINCDKSILKYINSKNQIIDLRSRTFKIETIDY